MATPVTLTHDSGLKTDAYVGFSWTSLFFGGFPTIFRGDWIGFLVYTGLFFLCVVFTAGVLLVVLWIAWAFLYNRWHLRRLIERGYRITGAHDLEGIRRDVLD